MSFSISEFLGFTDSELLNLRRDMQVSISREEAEAVNESDLLTIQ